MNRIEDVTNYITECDKEVGEALALEQVLPQLLCHIL